MSIADELEGNYILDSQRNSLPANRCSRCYGDSRGDCITYGRCVHPNAPDIRGDGTLLNASMEADWDDL